MVLYRPITAIFYFRPENVKKMITKMKAWAKEIEQLGGEIPKLQKEYAEEVSGLATAEVIQYTKKDMERIEANESRRQSREQAVVRTKRREEEI